MVCWGGALGLAGGWGIGGRDEAQEERAKQGEYYPASHLWELLWDLNPGMPVHVSLGLYPPLLSAAG